MKNDYPTIIQIGDCLISSDVFTEKFCCDYPVCKGCCCIIGDSGAPVAEDEKQLIEKEYPVFSKYMSGEGKAEVERNGYYTTDCDGDDVTPLINGEECAYTLFEGENCLCAMERAFFNGESKFRKPISCWLYPIRVSTLSNGMTALNLHKWDICRDAFRKGRKEGIPVFRFLKEPLTYRFGEEFYSALEEAYRLFEKA